MTLWKLDAPNLPEGPLQPGDVPASGRVPVGEKNCSARLSLLLGGRSFGHVVALHGR